MSGRDSPLLPRRQTPREKRSSADMLPPWAAEPSKCFFVQPREDTQLHSDAMQQLAGHAQQPSGADKTDDDLAVEAHAKLWVDRISMAQCKEALHPRANQGREQDQSLPQQGTSIEDLLAPPRKNTEIEGKIPDAVSTEDAQVFLLKDCCPLSTPVALDHGSWYCPECDTSSEEMRKRIAATMVPAASAILPASGQAHAADWDTDMPLPLLQSCCLTPFRASEDQEQILCDSCGGIFLDEEDAKSRDSSKTVPSGSTFPGTNSMGHQHSFETANQGTGVQTIMEENRLPFFAGGGIDDGSSDQTYLRSYSDFTQPSYSSYRLTQSSSNSYRPMNYQSHVNAAPSTTGIPSHRSRHRLSSRNHSRPLVYTHSPYFNTSTQETEERKDNPPTMESKVPTRKHELIESVFGYCRTCTKEGKFRNRECVLCHDCHSTDHATIECIVRVRKFHKFIDLPIELRKRIYTLALDTGRPIKPHLCDYPANEAIQFHDDNQKDHFATSDLLGITRVNKQIRAEALPAFYSANTFEIGPDTTTYFDRLAYLSRFGMIRHVLFSIETRKESASSGLLRRMNQYIKEADAFERSLAEPLGQHLSSLKRHPQYTYGGIPELNTLIALMKLTSPLASEAKGKDKADTRFHSKLVVPIPSAAAFTSFDRLKWFLVVIYGLGIQIHYVENMSFSSVVDNTVEITWYQRFQKKDFGDVPYYVNPVDTTGQTAAYTRALELDPELEQKQRPRGWAYLRTTCVGGISDWFDIATEGGGVGYGR